MSAFADQIPDLAEKAGSGYSLVTTHHNKPLVGITKGRFTATLSFVFRH